MRLLGVFLFAISSAVLAQDKWLDIGGHRLDLSSIGRTAHQTVVTVDSGNGPATAIIDCATRKITFNGKASNYVPTGSPEGFILGVACQRADPIAYPSDFMPRFCPTNSFGWERHVCSEQILRIAEREHVYLYAKALNQCKNKIDLIRFRKEMIDDADRCSSPACVSASYFRSDVALVNLLNNFPSNGMCSIDGKSPTVSLEFLENAKEDPREHAVDGYMDCSYKAAHKLDDGISSAEVIGKAVFSACRESAKLWAFSVQEMTGDKGSYRRFLDGLGQAVIPTNIVLELRQGRRGSKQEASKPEPPRPNMRNKTPVLM